MDIKSIEDVYEWVKKWRFDRYYKLTQAEKIFVKNHTVWSLQRDIPMKPKIVDKGICDMSTSGEESHIIGYYCPCCGRQLRVEEGCSFNDCRQRIDWNGIDELQSQDTIIEDGHITLREDITTSDYLICAITEVVYYNGYKDVLLKWRDAALSSDGQLQCPIEPEFWHTEIHCIWELFVSRFGDWGTSVRSGWIDNIDGFVYAIELILEEC